MLERGIRSFYSQAWFVVVLVVSVCLLPAKTPVLAAGPKEENEQEVAREYEIKAVFLFQFGKYITWKQADDDEELIIHVLGESEIVDPLKEIVSLQQNRGKRITVKEVDNLRESDNCKLLFIPQEYPGSVVDVFRYAVEHDIVTIGETGEYFGQGLAINFIIEEGKVRFDIDLRAVEGTDVSISSNLLRLARVVYMDQ